MAGIIPKEELAAYQRWSASSFEPARSAKAAESQTVTARPDLPESEIMTTMSLPTAVDIEQVIENARYEGYQAGLEEGRLAGAQTQATAMAGELARISGLISNLQEAIATMDQTIAEQVLELALEVAAQVIRGTITVNNDVMLPLIREAISALPMHHGHIMLHLNPADATSIREQIGEQLQQSGTHIVDDVTVTPGGCSLKAGISEIDATMETRWRRVLESIGSEPLEWQSTS